MRSLPFDPSPTLIMCRQKTRCYCLCPAEHSQVLWTDECELAKGFDDKGDFRYHIRRTEYEHINGFYGTCERVYGDRWRHDRWLRRKSCPAEVMDSLSSN